MSILIIDKSENARNQLRFLLNLGGYFDLVFATSIEEGFRLLDKKNNETKIDIIIFDIFMPESSGLDACYRIKALPHLKDIPLIAVTESLSIEDMLLAFEAGISDYISKPLDNKIELIPRVNSALQLRHEMEIRKAREKELIKMTTLLEESNKKLSDLASIDGLTRVANRRHFDHFFEKEWKRALRMETPLTILMADIDYFKPYNDLYGHQKGDECLIQFANALKKNVKRPCDLIARYGGEEFIILLTDTDSIGAEYVAKSMLKCVRSLRIPHEGSMVDDIITFSLGIYSQIPSENESPEQFIKSADQALYSAKKNGRNQYSIA
jgi:diguanylate cyclase (GGDEF)-like protein